MNIIITLRIIIIIKFFNLFFYRHNRILIHSCFYLYYKSLRDISDFSDSSRQLFLGESTLPFKGRFIFKKLILLFSRDTLLN